MPSTGNLQHRIAAFVCGVLLMLATFGEAQPAAADTITFDGFKAGELLQTGVKHREGDWIIEYNHRANAAAWIDTGNGDIGVEDTKLDVYGCPTKIYRVDGAPFTYLSIVGFDKDPRADKWSIDVRGYYKGQEVGHDRYVSIPATRKEYAASRLRGKRVDAIVFGNMYYQQPEDYKRSVVTAVNVAPITPPTIDIPATSPWFDTGVKCEEGKSAKISATGTWYYEPPAPDKFGPLDADGYCENPPAGISYHQFKYPPATMPDEWFGSLIGRCGETGSPFFVGKEFQGTFPTTGNLLLQMNDEPTAFSDNSGKLEVTIVVQ